MPPLLIQMLRSRWFAVTVHAGLWWLLFLLLSNFGGHAPDFHDSITSSVPAQSPAPVASLGSLFATPVRRDLADTNAVSPFFTSHFVPAPSPAPPPPPTSRKLDFTYHGFYQTGEGPRTAIVTVADKFVMAPIGGVLASNLFVAEATMRTLTLTNPAAQTNVLIVNVKKEIEVPIK